MCTCNQKLLTDVFGDKYTVAGSSNYDAAAVTQNMAMEPGAAAIIAEYKSVTRERFFLRLFTVLQFAVLILTVVYLIKRIRQ